MKLFAESVKDVRARDEVRITNTLDTQGKKLLQASHVYFQHPKLNAKKTEFYTCLKTEMTKLIKANGTLINIYVQT